MELFNLHTDIPEKDFERFARLNKSGYSSFYPLKDSILRKYGHSDSYDLQKIVVKCNACDGTGKFRKYTDWNRFVKEPCFRCDNGIYDTKYIALERWILNGTLYHIPLGRVNPHGLHSELGNLRYVNTIEGKIKKEMYDLKEVKRDYMTLLRIYDRNAFLSLVMSEFKYKHRKTKLKFMNTVRQYRSLLGGYLVYFGLVKAKPQDELPF